MDIDHFDFTSGGGYRYIHRNPAGEEYAFNGVFHVVRENDFAIQTFEFEGAPGHVSLDTLILEDRGARTLVRTISAHQTTKARDAMLENGMAGGMEEGYQQLDGLLTGLVEQA